MIAIRSALLLLLLLTAVPLSAQPARAHQASEADLGDILSSRANVPAPLKLVEEGGRSADEIAAGFPDPAEVSSLQVAWGFQANVYRTFAADPDTATVNGTVYLEVSLHAMATAADAELALDYYAEGRIEMLGFEPFSLAGPTIGDQSMAVVGSTAAGIDTTIYARLANVLARVTALAPEGYPLLDATLVAYEVVALADALLVPLSALLPAESDVPSGLTSVLDEERTIDEVEANYSDPAGTVSLFTEWGWEGNVARRFEGSTNVDGITCVYVSIHRFGSADAAAQVLDYSVADQAAATGASRITVSSIGERTRALVTTSAAGNEVTVYAQQGSILIRVTTASAMRNSNSEALRITEFVTRNVEVREANHRHEEDATAATGQSVPIAEPTVEPTALPAETGDCSGTTVWLSATEAQLIEADASIGNAVNNLMGMTPNPTTVEADADRVARLADDQWASAYPPAAQALNNAVVGYLQDISQTLTLLAQIAQIPTVYPPEYLPSLTAQLDRLTLDLPIRRAEVIQAIGDFRSSCGLP